MDFKNFLMTVSAWLQKNTDRAYGSYGMPEVLEKMSSSSGYYSVSSNSVSSDNAVAPDAVLGASSSDVTVPTGQEPTYSPEIKVLLDRNLGWPASEVPQEKLDPVFEGKKEKPRKEEELMFVAPDNPSEKVKANQARVFRKVPLTVPKKENVTQEEAQALFAESSAGRPSQINTSVQVDSGVEVVLKRREPKEIPPFKPILQENEDVFLPLNPQEGSSEWVEFDKKFPTVERGNPERNKEKFNDVTDEEANKVVDNILTQRMAEEERKESTKQKSPITEAAIRSLGKELPRDFQKSFDNGSAQKEENAQVTEGAARSLRQKRLKGFDKNANSIEENESLAEKVRRLRRERLGRSSEGNVEMGR